MPLSRTCLSLLLLCLAFASLTAQQDNYCGTTGTDPWLIQYKNGEWPAIPKSNEIQYIPLNVYFIGDDDDTNYPEPKRFFTSLNLLNSDFREQNIQFFILDRINYVGNSDYNDFDRDDVDRFTNRHPGQDMLLELNVANLLNTYVVANPSNLCGYNDRQYDAIVLGRNCLGAGDHTWAHEIGHMLSLNHTFYGWEGIGIDEFDHDQPAPTFGPNSPFAPVELVDSSNCDTAADRFCDTAPDYLADRWSCERDGTFQDTLTDPNGARFVVSGANIMSYANDACVSEFSNEQQQAMLTNIGARKTRGEFVHNETPPDALPDVADLNLISPADRSTTPFSDFVELTWSSVPNADFYLLEVNRTQNFNGGIQYFRVYNDTTVTLTEDVTNLDRRQLYWRVRAVNAFDPTGEFTEPYVFRLGENAVSTIDADLDAAITVAPNPIRPGEQLLVRAEGLPTSGALSFDLTDAAGRTVRTLRNLSTFGSAFTQRINTNGLSSGVYFLRLQLGNRMTTRRIILTE